MPHSPTRLPAELEAKIQVVAERLRRRQWIRHWIHMGLATLGLTLLFTLALPYSDSIGITRNTIIGLYLLCVLAASVILVVRPMRRVLPLAQVARYIDEHHPELQDRILSAVEFSSNIHEGESFSMIQQTLEESRVFTQRLRMSELVNLKVVSRLTPIVLFFFLLSLAVMVVRRDLWLPDLKLFNLWPGSIARSANFTVVPGNARIRSGSNQVIFVRSEVIGKKVSIQWKSGEQGEWQAEVMAQGASEDVHHHSFFNVTQDIDYQVTFGEERSAKFRITAWIPPEVASIDLAYQYPEYLGWAPREVPHGGPITALEGSTVDLSVRTNKGIQSAELVMESGEKIALASQQNTLWNGKLKVTRNDKYHIELTDFEGAKSEYNPEYPIAVQQDKPPQVAIDFPRGDSEVTSLEEIPIRFKVTDDFGISAYGLQYEVVGKKKEQIVLGDNAKEAGKSGATSGSSSGAVEAAGSQTLMLENMGLSAGDLITWTVWAKDRKPGRSEGEEQADPYFLEVRPFRKSYEEAVSNENAMQGMKMPEDESGGQKEIIIATYHLKQRYKGIDAAEFKRQHDLILEAQTKLQHKWQMAAAGMESAKPDEDVQKLMTAGAAALNSLQAASLPDPAQPLAEAINHMQEAYRQLLKMKPTHSQVMQAMSAGEGQAPKNSADVEQLEMKKNRNFYEQEKKTKQQQDATTEMASKLKELAERQKILNDEIARLISELQKSKTEEEKKELERQLEKLRQEEKKNLEELDKAQSQAASGEMENQQSQQTMKGLDQVRQDMNRSLDHLNEDRLQEARSSGSRALEGLKELQEKLENLSRASAAEQMKEIQKDLGDLREKQKGVEEKLKAVKAEQDTPAVTSHDDAGKKREGILSEKKALEEQFKKLMNDAAELAEKSAQNQELMSRKLGDWLRETSREGILEEMQQSAPLVQQGVWDAALMSEEQIQEKLANAASGLDEAAEAAVTDDTQAMQKALDELQAMLEGEKGKSGQKGDRDVAGNDAKGEKQQSGGSNPKAAEELAREAKDLLAQGKTDEAIKKLEQAVAADPKNQQARQQLAIANSRKGDMEEAIDQMARGMGLNADDPKTRENLRRVLSKSNQPGGDQAQSDGKGQARAPGETEGKQGSEQSPDGKQEGPQGEQSSEASQPGQNPGKGKASGQSAESKPGEQSEAESGPNGTAKGNSTESSGKQNQSARDDRNGTQDPNGGRVGGGGRNFTPNPPRPQDMEEFMRSGYREWTEQLADAEALLPKESDYRRQIERVRGDIEKMRQEYKRHTVPPRYDLFLNDVFNPLKETARKLEAEILKGLREEEFVLTGEGEVPAQYQKRVADYFESLARSEGSR